MAASYVFADEAGCFTFKRKDGASKYFILCTVTAQTWTISDQLLEIRRELALLGEPDRDKLHATSDLQIVRDLVFAVIQNQKLQVDATILQKTKAMPKIRQSEAQFYQYAWFYHFKQIGPPIAAKCDKMLITAAALGSKKTKAAFKLAVNNTIQQILPRDKWEVAFHESGKDPLLWVADYCAWAIQRKWETGCEKSHSLISKSITTEYDLFAPGRNEYY